MKQVVGWSGRYLTFIEFSDGIAYFVLAYFVRWPI